MNYSQSRAQQDSEPRRRTDMADQPNPEDLISEATFTGKRILVVDDNKFVSEMISKVLAKYMKIEAVPARSGSQAIAAALTSHYDGAIIDLALKNASGGRIIRTIKTMLPSFPILAMSVRPTADADKSLGQYGAVRILHKPFKITTLIDELTLMLRADKTLSARDR